MQLGFIQLTGPFTGGMNILTSVLQPNIIGTVSRLGIQSKIGNSYLITYSNNKRVTLTIAGNGSLEIDNVNIISIVPNQNEDNSCKFDLTYEVTQVNDAILENKEITQEEYKGITRWEQIEILVEKEQAKKGV